MQKSRVFYPARPVDVAVIREPRERRAIGAEIAVVLLLTFGLSGLQAILSLIEAELNSGIGSATVSLNSSTSPHPYIDLARQLLGIIKLSATAGLAICLLYRSGIPLRRIGITRSPARGDFGWGVLAAAAIGIPGLALYALGRVLGIGAHVQPSDLTDTWWRLPVLLLSAFANGAAEEFLVVGYLINRLRQLGWHENSSLLASAVLRGSYHLYQGFGAGIGNFAMGLVFGRYHQITGRIWPLVIGHGIIDAVAFVGYALLRNHLGWLP